MNVSLYWLLCDPTLLLRVLAVLGLYATSSLFVIIIIIIINFPEENINNYLRRKMWLTDRQIDKYQKRSIYSGEEYLTICVEWAANPVNIMWSSSTVVVWRKSIHFWRRYTRKWCLHFCSQWPWPLTFRPQICSPKSLLFRAIFPLN